MNKHIALVALSLLIFLPCHGHAQTSGNHDSDHAKLVALEQEVLKLKEEVGQLKIEIQELRRLLATQPHPATYSEPPAQSTGTKEVNATDTGYWCTKSSNKRHNPSCRYYKTSNGRPCGPNDGIPCKLCGG